MAKGMALTIGLNLVDQSHYADWDGKLIACENDAQDLAAILKSRGFEVDTLLTRDATRKNVMARITQAATTLKAGDLFLLYYSGHGGHLPYKHDDEPDGLDETWCLYDAELVDDEIFAMLGRFAAGVRIFVLSDSCHSGTVLKAALYQPILTMRTSMGSPPRYKFLPGEKADQAYRKNKAFYDAILTDPKLGKNREEIKASAILISGCLDSQYSEDGIFNSLFTAHLLRVWHEGKYTGSIKTFHQTIKNFMPPTQTPNYFLMGPSNQAFEDQAPFTI
jgi:metacaspase-1